MKRIIKTILWILLGLVVAAALAAGVIYILSGRAVANFRRDAASQLNSAVAGKTVGAPVTLSDIWFANLLNPDYKKIANAQTNYQNLLSDLENYNLALNVYDSLVSQYNSGINGNKPLTGDVLKTVNQYLAVVQNRYPQETARIATLKNLSNEIANNTTFDAVSGDINNLLQNDDGWLTGLRTGLNSRISSFQKTIQ